MELIGQTIEIGDKKSGWPGYKITDKERNWVEWKLQMPNLTEAEPLQVEIGEDFVSYNAGNFEAKYEINQTGVKPYYILNEKPKTENFILNFDLDFSPDLELVANPKGQISAYTLFDQYGVPIFEIKSPDAIDASGKKTYPSLIILQTKETKKAFILLDPEFLKNAVYPIIIDPTTISSSALANATQYANGRKLFADSNGNLLAVYADSSGNIKVAYCNAVDDCTSAGNWTTDADSPTGGENFSAAIDTSTGDIHIAMQHTEARTDVHYVLADVIYTGADITDISFSGMVDIGLSPGANREHKRPSIIILHDGKPAVVWAYETTGGSKDSKVYFLRCINTCTGAVGSNWGGVGGTADGVADEIYDTNVNLKFIPSIAQMPGTGTDAKNFYVFWTQSGGTALKYVKANCTSGSTCSNTPPTWTLGGAVTKDSSSVPSGSYTMLNTLMDSANERIVTAWFSSDATDCSNTYCLLTYFITKDGSDSSNVREIHTDATEANVDTQPSLTLYAGLSPDSYLVFLKNSSGNLVRRQIEAPSSTATDWISGSSWSSAMILDSGTTNSWPQAKIDDAGSQWDIIYMSTASTLSYESGQETRTIKGEHFRWRNDDGPANGGDGSLDANFGTAGVVSGVTASQVANAISIDSTYLYAVGVACIVKWRIE